MILIGYSGHAFVVCGIANAAGLSIEGYCDGEEKLYNPFTLKYLGKESEVDCIEWMKKNKFFVSIGDNKIREKIFTNLLLHKLETHNLIHPSAIIDNSSILSSAAGIMVAANVTINPLAKIAQGVICNTGCIIEHECIIEEFAHIGPGAVLCGNVVVGKGSFVGARAVIKQGITVGSNVIVGAGAVVVKNVPNNVTVVGCPAKII